jgi:hypothetical protein
MVTDQECVNFARECVRLAGMTSDPEMREQMLKLARQWLANAGYEGGTAGLPSGKPLASGL